MQISDRALAAEQLQGHRENMKLAGKLRLITAISDGPSSSIGEWLKIVGLAVPAIAALALGLWGSEHLSLWRDEGMSLLVARRSVPDIFRFLSHLDSVHGAYYLFLHGVITLFGTSELALRLPSAFAFAIAAAGVTVLGKRLISPLGGFVAGLLYAGAPFAGRHAIEARPYAIVAALAVLVTVLLVRALDDGTWPRYLWYGAALLVLGTVHLFALLIAIAHFITLILVRRKHLRRWFVVTFSVGLLLVPLVLHASTQAASLSYLQPPGWDEFFHLAATFSGSKALLIPMGMAVMGGILFVIPRGPVDVRVLALPWLIMPAALLILISQFHAYYQSRYVIASLPAVALLAAGGIVRLKRGTWLVPVIVIIVMLSTVQTRLRNPENWPEQLREAANVIHRESRPSDAIVWLPTNRRALAAVYPHGFGRLQDITLAVSPIKAENFGGVEISPSNIKKRLSDPTVTRVWLVDGEIPWRGPTLDPLNRSKVNSLEQNFYRIAFWRFRGLSLTLYEK